MSTPSLPPPPPSRDSPYETRIGAHLFRWEPPDTVYLAYCGDLTGDSMRSLTEVGRQFTLGQPYIFVITDMTKCGKVSSEARRISGVDSKDLNFRGLAVFGASAAMRIVIGLVVRAVDLIHNNTDNPTRFFEAEADARDWIAFRRARVSPRDERETRGSPRAVRAPLWRHL